MEPIWLGESTAQKSRATTFLQTPPYFKYFSLGAVTESGVLRTPPRRAIWSAVLQIAGSWLINSVEGKHTQDVRFYKRPPLVNDR